MGLEMGRELVKTAISNQFMWIPYDLLKATEPVIAFVASRHNQNIEVQLLEADYPTVPKGTRVIFRPQGGPTCQELMYYEDKKVEEARAAVGTASDEQVGSIDPEVSNHNRFLLTQALAAD